MTTGRTVAPTTAAARVTVAAIAVRAGWELAARVVPAVRSPARSSPLRGLTTADVPFLAAVASCFVVVAVVFLTVRVSDVSTAVVTCLTPCFTDAVVAVTFLTVSEVFLTTCVTGATAAAVFLTVPVVFLTVSVTGATVFLTVSLAFLTTCVTGATAAAVCLTVSVVFLTASVTGRRLRSSP